VLPWLPLDRQTVRGVVTEARYHLAHLYPSIYLTSRSRAKQQLPNLLTQGAKPQQLCLFFYLLGSQGWLISALRFCYAEPPPTNSSQGTFSSKVLQG
jgi:hypothetical protein